MHTQQRSCGQGRQWGRGKGDREGERGRGHSDSEVERRDVPYNTAPKTMKKIAENYENYENYEKLRS
jgi:hypothetical protein